MKVNMELSPLTTRNPRQFFLILTAIVAALGGFLFGYDTGIISGALIFIQQTYHASVFAQEIIVSSVVLGALLGAILSGKLAELYGSRQMLIWMAVTFALGTLLSTFALNITMLIFSRFIIGIAIGITSYISPLFISEMSPAKNRGALVLLNGIMITSGETIAFLIDYALVPTQSWRYMFATGLIPALLLFVGMLLLPASPRWAVLKGRFTEARAILCKVRDKSEVDAELNDIIHSTQWIRSGWSTLFSKKLWPVLCIGLGLGVLQQFVGINTVMYYGPTIFGTAGFKNHSSQMLATFGMGLMNTLMSIVAVLIVDKIGRRRLLLAGLTLAGMSLGLVGLIFYSHIHTPFFIWLNCIFMLSYIAGYSLSIGSLFWLIISEIYPLHVRSLAMSFVTAVQWAANFLVALTFLSILNSIGPVFTFWLYSCMCLISFFFCYYLVPETRGISLEHIENNLRLGKNLRELGQTI